VSVEKPTMAVASPDVLVAYDNAMTVAPTAPSALPMYLQARDAGENCRAVSNHLYLATIALLDVLSMIETSTV